MLCRKHLGLPLALIACTTVSTVTAANWEVAPRVQAGYRYSDNYRLYPPGQEIDVSGAEADVGVTFRTIDPRTNFEITPRINSTYFPDEKSEDANNYYLTAGFSDVTPRRRIDVPFLYSQEDVTRSELPDAGEGGGLGKPAYVDFVRVPAMWNEGTRMHARIFYTAELLGKLDELHSLIFREVHVGGNQLNSVDKIAAFFQQHGVSKDEFTKAFSSFAVESKLQRADFLNKRYRIQSVPAVIVNGKYTTDIGTAGGESQLFGLIDELAAHEHGG